jgi:hypothetical protein
MTKIFKFKEHEKWCGIANNLIEDILNPRLLESSENSEGIVSILKNLQKDLNFNVKLIFTFGTGIASMYPIVLNLIQNQKLKIDASPENISLLTLTSVVILSMEMQKDSEVTKEEVKNLLTELKLRGIGNGIVKKMVNSFKSIGNLLTILFKNTSKTVRNIIDMFAYTSLLIPTMNAINTIVSNYDWTMDTIIGNLSSLGIGIMTFLAKNGWDYLVKKLKNKTEINPDIKVTNNSPNSDIGNPKDSLKSKAELINEQ